MIYMWSTGINYYKLAVEKDRDSIFTTITTIWKPRLRFKNDEKNIYTNDMFHNLFIFIKIVQFYYKIQIL
jgi:hypothetical protein